MAGFALTVMLLIWQENAIMLWKSCSSQHNGELNIGREDFLWRWPFPSFRFYPSLFSI